MEVLKDPEQLEFFRHFLRQQQGGGAEAQLVFWTAVEDLKSSMNSKRSCRSKTRNIQRRFFRSGTAERSECKLGRDQCRSRFLPCLVLELYYNNLCNHCSQWKRDSIVF